MRIISGSARGKIIEAPEGLDTRPVTDKIRQSLFNIWQFEIPGSRFLDLFSGSGSMGLEAMSRGAKTAVMVEKGKEAGNVIRRNIKACHFDGKDARLMNEDVFRAIEKLSASHETFDFIYLDPPYTVDEIFHPVMEALAASSVYNENTVIALRSHKNKKMNESYGPLKKYREKTYGISTVHFYRLDRD
ncbi:MAG: 16S rRNA (guanine(966)-N(2))-methyltransferase RsmD [Erysipelotrichaceae bacterium]|nr:16S rRNA (guanine(966)-N(2))-methyltransferase RsmD [Erysipelotrichaceae bacterium]